MPGFTLTGHANAPVEEVWKLLFDPTRFPEWWVGIETVQTERPGEYIYWPPGHPHFPMPQKLRADRAGGRVMISCQVSDIDIAWQLAEAGAGTGIEVRVDFPDNEAYRIEGQRVSLGESLDKLAALAESAAVQRPSGPKTR